MITLRDVALGDELGGILFQYPETPDINALGPKTRLMELPMFPLGMVLFPSLFLPLHVFEPRYRVLARHCMDGNREFGVVLIERGSEVGGNDVRTSVGTVAQIVDATELDDGRWVLGTVGTRRVRVHEWLTDDPYPRADVDDWDGRRGRS